MFSMGSCPAQPIFSLNRVHEVSNYISQYMHEVTIKHYDKLKFKKMVYWCRYYLYMHFLVKDGKRLWIKQGKKLF